jgi:hypothetical protein
MKLPDFTIFKPLNDLRKLMGAAELGEFATAINPHHLTIQELDRLSRSGIDIPLEEIDFLKDGTLAYKDRRVVLYIRDVFHYRSEDKVDLPRFHISSCSTLNEMKRQRRFERYVVATREDGIFEININVGQNFKKSEERLKICQNCLERIRWEGFSRNFLTPQKRQIVEKFMLSDFFKAYGKSIEPPQPTHTDKTAPLNEYVINWSQISQRIKSERGNRCEKCGNTNNLHVHHINGIRYDNLSSNLKVLCATCHAEEPYHSHMKANPVFKILKLG